MGRLEVQEVTHDELLIEINRRLDVAYYNGDPQSMRALRAVVELHKPTEPDIYLEEDEKYLICNVCMEFDEEVKYPCPTIQAIEKELG